MSRRRIIIVNTISNLGLQLVSAGLPFLLLPFMLRYWGADTYGVLVLGYSVQGIIQILNGAIALTLMKYVSELHEKGDFFRLNSVINSFLVVTFINNALVASALIATGLFGLSWLNVSEAEMSTARLVFIEIGLFGMVTGVFLVIDGVMYGMQKIHLANVFRVWESIFTAMTAVAIIHFKGNLVQYVFVISLFPILTRVVQLFHVKKLLPFLDINPLKYFDFGELKKISGFSGFQIINQVADLLLFNVQKLTIQRQLGTGALTIYEIGNKPNLMFQNFISLPLSAILPACSAAYARDDKNFLEGMLITGTRLYLIFVLPPMFALVILMPEFLQLWLHGDYDAAVPVAQFFLCSLMVIAPFKVFSHMMVGKARVFEYGVTKLVYALLGIPLSYFLVGQFGVTGGVIVIFGYCLFVEVPTNLYVMRAEGISVARFLLSILPIAALLVVEYVCLSAGPLLDVGAGWISFLVVSGSSIAAVILGGLFLVMKRSERRIVGIPV